MREEVSQAIEEARAHIEPPPLVGSWRNAYLLVLAHLALWIVAFYWFTTTFNLP